LSPDFDFRSGSRSASTDVAKALRIDPGSSVWARFRWQRHDDQVLHHSREYLPQWVSRHPALRNALRDPQAQTYDLLRKAGHRLVRLEETVEVVSASADEAEMLGLDVRRPAPVTRITRIAFGAGDRPLEVNHIVAPARRITLRYDLPGFA
jgi:DNA-binding GntR family transcriptional regulator